MKTLCLLIDETWPAEPATDWVLLGARGAVLGEGRSDARHWPAAERQVAVLAGAQVSLCSLVLPKHRRADRARLIAYALEERLPSETERHHFTVTEHRGERTGVAAVESARLRELTAAFAALNRPLSAVHARIEAVPWREKAGVCHDEGGWRYWRWPDGAGFSEDRQAGVSYLARAAVREHAPEALVGDAAVAAALGLPAGPAATVAPWYALGAASNLLHGEFAPRATRGGWGQVLRWPLRLAGAALAVHLALGLGAAWQGRQQEQALNAKVGALFATTFPGAAMVDPLLQTRRQVGELRARQGALRDDDLLALLMPLAEALGGEAREAVASLGYEAPALEVSLTRALDPARRKNLTEALAMRGIEARVGASPEKLKLRPGQP